MDKQLYTLVYPCEQHNARLSWLYKHASITAEQDFKYFDESISISVLLDEVTYQRHLKAFGETEKLASSRHENTNQKDVLTD